MAGFDYSDFDPDQPDVRNAAQAELDRRKAQNAQKGQGLMDGIGDSLGVIGAIVGGVYGGPAGASVGLQAGKAAGGAVTGGRSKFPGADQLQGAIDFYAKQKKTDEATAAGEGAESGLFDAASLGGA